MLTQVNRRKWYIIAQAVACTESDGVALPAGETIIYFESCKVLQASDCEEAIRSYRTACGVRRDFEVNRTSLEDIHGVGHEITFRIIYTALTEDTGADMLLGYIRTFKEGNCAGVAGYDTAEDALAAFKEKILPKVGSLRFLEAQGNPEAEITPVIVW